MMDADALIAGMARDLRPVPRHAVRRRLLGGIVCGGLVSLLLIAAWLGFRDDLRQAMHGFAFWMKWSYTMSLAIGAVALVARLARPQPVRLGAFWPLALPVAALAIVTVTELADMPRADWLAAWLGASWKVCPWLVFLLSMPIFAGLLWSFRQLAPTRLRAAGAAAGLAAGAWAAMLYCLHCPEVSALFVLSWYSLGIALAGGAGAVVGPRLLRW